MSNPNFRPGFCSLAANAKNRNEFWINFINQFNVRSMAEIGVARGHFSEVILRECSGVETYYMIDPWKHLPDWNKPVNQSDTVFAEMKAEALERTEFARKRRVVLQGRTVDRARLIERGSLDLVYIDGDHTARGILTDLITCWPLVHEGGVLAGDDFSVNAWVQGPQWEPTLIFPLAVYFAEAVGAPIYGLPHYQFVIPKGGQGFAFHDLTGAYPDTSMRAVLRQPEGKRGLLRRVLGKARRLMGD